MVWIILNGDGRILSVHNSRASAEYELVWHKGKVTEIQMWIVDSYVER